VPAAADAPPAARLREAGAVLLGKTTMPDYGMLSSGLSSFHALTRNPWDLRRNPGGSSAGAAAAAAAGYGPLHVGTDIGGSIRLPAAWCGVVGFKPSAGRVPIQPPYLGRVAGPITRHVADAALLMATLSRPDVRDATSLPFQPLAWADLASDPQPILRGRRIGLLLDAGWGLPLDPEVRIAIEGAAAWAAGAGAQVEPLAAFTTREMADGINLFWRTRSWLDISALPPERQALVLPFIRAWVAAAAGFSAAQLFHGYSQFAALRDAAVAACQPFDFVLSPVAPCVAFDAEWAMPTNDPLRAMEHIGFTLPCNVSEQPAISVPIAHNAAGLPIGLQIIGRRHDDLGVLHVARAIECLRGAQRPWPQPPA
jgi:aspartyl-tRNA(Asn)/glutamyl-tRNA(Gln) amidotransferase subunit A